MIVKHSKIIGMWGIVEKWWVVIQTFEAVVMYRHFDEAGIVNMQGFLQSTRKMQFFVRFRFYEVYRLKTSA